MHTGRARRAVVLALALVLALPAAGGFASPASADGPTAVDEHRGFSLDSPDAALTGHESGAFGSNAAAEAGSGGTANLTVTQTFARLPEHSGEVSVRLRFDPPEGLTGLETSVPADATVTDREGFSREDPTTYGWDGETEPATLTYTVGVNETVDARGPESARGRLLSADVGEWALFTRPEASLSWTRRGDSPPVTVDRRLATDGPGAAGEWLVYLGETETHTRTAHGQTFELVVPERAALAESPDAVLGSLAAASNQVRVGDRDGRVFAVAAPTGRVDWGVRGAQFGERDMWVRDAERLDTPENTWLHEYVHSRQDYGTTAETRWTTEAIATYYAALLPLEQGRIDAETFRRHLRWGTRSPQADAVLSDPLTWYNAANYLKGMTVIGHLDREIRAATDGERSFQDVFSRLNARTGELESGRPERIDRAEFLGIVGNVSSAGVRADAERYATTEEAPEVWSAETHEAVFGTTPARISERFRSDGFSVEGPFRNGSLGEPPLTVYVGEEVTAVGEVTNAGDTATEFRSRIYADDEAVASDAAAIKPGETRTYEATHAFTEPGEHSLTIGSETVSVRVRRPGSVVVEDLSADRARLDGPGAVALTATVTADGAGYASGRVTFTRGGDPVAHRNVTLGPGERRTVSATVTLESAGEYELGAGEADPVVVTVADPDGGTGSEPTDDGEGPRTERSGDGTAGSGGTTGSGGAETVASGPGFAPLVAVVALAAVALGLAIARER